MTDATSSTISQPAQVGWRGAWLGWIGLATLLCFHWMPLSYYRMVGWPWILIWQGGFLCFGLGLIWMLRQFDQPFRGLGYGLDWLMAATAGVLVLSAIFSPFPQVAIWNVVLVASYGLLVYFLFNYLAVTPAWRYRLWDGLVIAGTGTALVSLGFWRPSADMLTGGNFWTAIRNHQPLGHHNFVGGYMVLLTPVMLVYGLAHKGWQRWVGGGSTLLLIVTTYVSGSRGAALGLLAWVIVAVGSFVWRSRGRQRQIAIGLGLVALVLVTGLMFTNPRTRDLLSSFRSYEGPVEVARLGDGPTRDRLFMVQTGLNILRDRPLLGVGPGNMPRVSELYRPIEAGSGLTNVQQLHNTPAQLWGELGLAGLGLYLAWLGTVVYLGWQLSRKLQGRDRTLLYGLGGGLLAYGISSLTDYQLENIGISSTLALYLVLLAALVYPHRANPGQMTCSVRRLSSLGLVGGIALLVGVWFPVDLAFFLGHTGLRASLADNVVEANRDWSRAAAINPTDPTFNVFAAQELLELRNLSEDEDTRQTLLEEAIGYSQDAIAVAPNDSVFNQNLSVLLLETGENLAEAAGYAQRSIQLSPRNRHYNYYLLAQIHLAQQQPNLAAAALVLESLVHPQFLAFPIWQEQPFAGLQAPVVEAVAQQYELLLSELSPADYGYAVLYEQLTLLRWWFEQPIDSVESAYLRPITQAFLLAEESPEDALEILNAEIESTAPDAASALSSLRLLRAWIDPERYTDSLFESASGSEELSDAEQASIRAHLTNVRDLRQWLTAFTEEFPQAFRGQLAFVYRNALARRVTLRLLPPNLVEYRLVRDLNLFPRMPRELPVLDRQIEQFRTETLDLPHPTQNGFSLNHGSSSGR